MQGGPASGPPCASFRTVLHRLPPTAHPPDLHGDPDTAGEVVVSGNHVRGLAVHAAARIVDQAAAGEVLLSGTTHDLAEGATGLEFESRGRFRLKGLSREHELFSVGLR